MANIKIVTDSTAYLTEEQINKYDITVVPLAVNLGNESFKEGEKYTNKEFFEKLSKHKDLFPTTSQPADGEFKEAYERLNKEADSIITITISEGISGTLSSAKTGADLAGGVDVTVIDSLSTSAGLEQMVIQAASLAQAGESKEEIIKVVEHIRDNLTTLFMVDTFEYLKRGGRIGGASAMLGTMLQIKPILFIHGKIDVFQKVRTRKKAIGRMEQELNKFLQENGLEKTRVSVLTVDCREAGEEFFSDIKQKYPGLNCSQAEIGPVVGSHVGPGTIGLAFCSLP